MQKPSPIPLKSKKSQSLKCTLGCPLLDTALRGGIPCGGSITEIVGECASGKTQLSLQLLLCAQLPPSQGGLAGSSLYIYTEGYFAIRRLHQLSQNFFKINPVSSVPPNPHSNSSDSVSSKPCDRDSGQFDSENKQLCSSRIEPHSLREGEMCKTLDAGNLGFLKGKRKIEDPSIHTTDKRIRCDNDSVTFENQDTEFWDAVDLAELQALEERNPSSSFKNGYESRHQEKDPCDNIFVQGVHTIEELLNFLEHVELQLLRPLAMPIRLVVIDSVAALFRSDFDNTAQDLKKRSSFFFKLSSKLKSIAQKFDLAVVVTNQVVDCVESNNQQRADMGSGLLISSGRRVVPALGLSWSHCINIRLFLSRMEELTSIADYCNDSLKTVSNSSSAILPNRKSWNGKVKRRLQVVFAPHLPTLSCDFVIDKFGLHGIQYLTVT